MKAHELSQAYEAASIMHRIAWMISRTSALLGVEDEGMCPKNMSRG